MPNEDLSTESPQSSPHHSYSPVRFYKEQIMLLSDIAPTTRGTSTIGSQESELMAAITAMTIMDVTDMELYTGTIPDESRLNVHSQRIDLFQVGMEAEVRRWMRRSLWLHLTR